MVISQLKKSKKNLTIRLRIHSKIVDSGAFGPKELCFKKKSTSIMFERGFEISSKIEATKSCLIKEERVLLIKPKLKKFFLFKPGQSSERLKSKLPGEH